LSYESETGVITWIAKRPGVTKGMVAGFMSRKGYRSIEIDGVSHRAHRIAWALFHGQYPEIFLDHKNGIRNDNRIANLREATASQNGANTKITTNNKSGKRGVSWNKQCQKWSAQIYLNRKQKFLGLFSSVEDAHNAYTRAAQELFGEFARAA
jgi:hypothetical protein